MAKDEGQTVISRQLGAGARKIFVDSKGKRHEISPVKEDELIKKDTGRYKKILEELEGKYLELKRRTEAVYQENGVRKVDDFVTLDDLINDCQEYEGKLEERVEQIKNKEKEHKKIGYFRAEGNAQSYRELLGVKLCRVRELYHDLVEKKEKMGIVVDIKEPLDPIKTESAEEARERHFKNLVEKHKLWLKRIFHSLAHLELRLQFGELEELDGIKTSYMHLNRTLTYLLELTKDELDEYPEKEKDRAFKKEMREYKYSLMELIEKKRALADEIRFYDSPSKVVTETTDLLKSRKMDLGEMEKCIKNCEKLIEKYERTENENEFTQRLHDELNYFVIFELPEKFIEQARGIIGKKKPGIKILEEYRKAGNILYKMLQSIEFDEPELKNLIKDLRRVNQNLKKRQDEVVLGRFGLNVPARRRRARA